MDPKSPAMMTRLLCEAVWQNNRVRCEAVWQKNDKVIARQLELLSRHVHTSATATALAARHTRYTVSATMRVGASPPAPVPVVSWCSLVVAVLIGAVWRVRAGLRR